MRRNSGSTLAKTNSHGQQPSAILCSGLTRKFGGIAAVDSLDLDIPYRQVFGLLGPNGAGKSTTIKMLTTLLDPTGGTAFVAGFDLVRQQAEVRRRIGYVPQMLSADGALTGYENLIFSARLYGVSGSEAAHRIDETLELMGLQDSARRLVRTYSGGMIRRLELAQTMLHRPAILFLDEPTIGLDPVARRTVWDRLKDLRRDYGMTILLTTHDMDEADELCDELAILHSGRIAVKGAPAELKRKVGRKSTLEDVFAHYVGGTIHEGGNYRDVRSTRRTVARFG
ncbi:MAG: ATP-binding cassette domain-containing protein [Spirochaetia bacterium]|nr:ATP-binding cassette domain-containing protein [Spirochaetia bacterium]